MTVVNLLDSLVISEVGGHKWRHSARVSLSLDTDSGSSHAYTGCRGYRLERRQIFGVNAWFML